TIEKIVDIIGVNDTKASVNSVIISNNSHLPMKQLNETICNQEVDMPTDKSKKIGEQQEQKKEVINRVNDDSSVIIIDAILRYLKLDGMRIAFSDKISGDNPPSKDFVNNFHDLVITQKRTKDLGRLHTIVKKANLTYQDATVETIIYDINRQLNKDLIDRLSTCEYINKGEHVCIFGPTGAGKTFISCALGMAAAKRLYKVKYFRLPQLLNIMNSASKNSNLDLEIKKLHKFDLLIIDEFLNFPIDDNSPRNLLELLEDRSRNKSVIFASICKPNEWLLNLGGSSPLSQSIVDRIIHKTYNIIIKGERSMRELEKP
ncbi:MAG: ATP-binding protein, partial [Lactobacillales bacterium]|nr:ATP-binding protein [Lactobacillales bacterium]